MNILSYNKNRCSINICITSASIGENLWQPVPVTGVIYLPFIGTDHAYYFIDIF